MKDGVNLFYDYNERGPGKVVKNLIKGLDEIEIPHLSNNYDDKSKNYYHGMLQSIDKVHNEQMNNILCGPNLFILPIDWGDRIKNFNHYIVPSQWVLEKYSKFHAMSHATIDVWPVGIDTEFWKRKSMPTSKKALIYFKGRFGRELVSVSNKLNELKIDYDIIEYGNYTEQELITACNNCQFAILLTGTESQGIGYMEILSMGLPCYVFDKTIWNYYPSYPNKATSVPYFDSTCGIITEDFNLEKLDEFIQSLETYSPREYICNNFTLAQKAKDYYFLLEKYNCKKEKKKEKNMAHKEQKEYFMSIKNMFPRFFEMSKVLDVGSLDVNGNNRYLFKDCYYIGIDVAEGENVTQATLCHEYNSPDNSFDIIISNDCFEHDMYWEKSLQKIVKMLKSGGLFLFTCKTTGSEEHGTLRTDGGFSSPLTSKIPEWENYYRNITESDVRSVIPIEEIFEKFEFSINEESSDIRFYGIKK